MMLFLTTAIHWWVLLLGRHKVQSFLTNFFWDIFQIIRELREEVDRLKRLLAAKIAGKSHIVEPGETTIEIEEMLSESEKLMSECTMTWEQKEKQTEKIQQVKKKL